MHLIHKAGLALALIIGAIFLSIPAVAAGNPIYVELRNSQFGILNPTSGAFTLIGTFSQLIGGLAFGADGTLYGVSQNGTGSLFVVNTGNAGLTFIGNTGMNTSLGTPGFNLGSTSDGALYAVNSGITYQINPTTAVTTTLGPTGFITGGGLTGDDKGNLYVTGGQSNQNFYQVNRTTGQGTLVGTSTYGGVDGLAYTGGTLYAINRAGSIFSVNTATAASTLTATYNTANGSVYAAAAQLSPVPEASSTVSLGLLLLLGLGGVAISRRRKAGAAR